jgi:5-methylcytosine-specific restriction endonuclease McrA
MPLCSKCRTEKGRHEFPKNRARPSGLNQYCFVCNRQRPGFRITNPDKYQEYLQRRRLTPEQWAEKRRSNKTANMSDYQRNRNAAISLARDLRTFQTCGVSLSPTKNGKCPIFSSKFARCKPCTQCGEVKNLDEFQSRPSVSDGRQSYCKRCRLKLDRKRRSARPEKARAKARERYRNETPKQRVDRLARTKRAKTRRRSRVKDLRSDLTAAQWADLKAIYGHRCAYCGQKKPLTQDHVVPIAMGGEHTASNVVPACGPCNSSKGARLPIRTFQPHLIA